MAARTRLLALVVAVFAVASAPASAAHTLYVANSGSNDVSALAVGPGWGLSLLPGFPFGGGLQNRALAFTPDGSVLYTASTGSGTNNGAVNVLSTRPGGSLAVIPGGLPTERNPAAMTVSPSGRFLYVANGNGATRSVSGYAIAPGGALTQLPGSPYVVDTLTGVAGVAITPDGRFLYVIGSGSAVYGFALGADGVPVALPWSPHLGDIGSGQGIAVSPRGDLLFTTDTSADAVRVFSIGGDGSLTKNPQGPVSTGGDNPTSLAISPDGRFVYTPNRGGTGALSGFQVAVDGTLGELPGSPYALGVTAVGAALSANGQHLYVSGTGGANDLFAFTVAADGSLAAVAGSPFASGGTSAPGTSSVGGLRLAPDQGPVAALAASAPAADGTVAFDASASADAEGSVARYDWSFGDGSVLSNAGPKPAHRYGAAGRYTASVTLTDDQGCSTSQVYTGQMPLCNGSAAATGSVGVSVGSVDPAPTIAKLKLGKRKQNGMKVSFRLSEAAKVRVTVAQAASGRRVKGRCRRVSRSNRGRPRCTRYVAVGSRTVAGKAGANSFVLGTKIGRHELTAGSYRLTLVAIDRVGGKSPALRRSFTVLSPRRRR
jgi:DNA-binding beta-propeller fold protein YncE